MQQLELKAKYGSKRTAYIHAEIVGDRNCNENYRKFYTIAEVNYYELETIRSPSEKVESSESLE